MSPVHVPEFTPAERGGLMVAAALGFVVANGAFVYGLVAVPDAMQRALGNPIALAFMVEALLLMVLGAWLVHRWRPSRLGAGWFIVLSLVGSLAFSIPVLLLTPRERNADARR